MVRHVAGGVDVGLAGAAPLVNEHAVGLRDRRADERRHLRLDPDPGDDEIARARARPWRSRAASTRSAPSNAATRSPASSSTPCSPWIAANAAPTSSPRTRSSGARPGKIAVTRTPSCLSDAATSQPMNPIPTTTACRPACDLPLDRLALGDRAQIVDPRQLRARHLEPAVPAAGRDQELLIAELLARIEHDRVGGRVDLHDAGLHESLDAMLLIPTRGLDVPPVEILLRAQVRLGQRRAAERNPRLSANDHNPPEKPSSRSVGCGIASGQPTADDHDGLIFGFGGHR